MITIRNLFTYTILQNNHFTITQWGSKSHQEYDETNYPNEFLDIPILDLFLLPDNTYHILLSREVVETPGCEDN